MKLSVAANYDIELVRELAELPVTDVYGKLPSDLTGGGRPGYLSTSVTLSHLKSYIDELKKKKIEFTYLLNSSCLANREWDRRWQKKFFRFMKRLEEIGVARLTVSTPVLFRIIRKSFPDFYLKVGVFAQVDTPSRARYWQDLGADEITLESFSINRDFERLAKVRESVSCGLQLIVNHPCLPNCPIQYYHQNGFSHSCDNSGKIFIDYCFLTCSYQRLKDPSLFIKSQWIRPEDLSDYEDAGFDNFKILERSIPSVQLLRRVRAYSRRKSPPDFADLILPHGFSQTKKRWTWLVRNFFRPLQIRPTKLVPIYRLIKNQGILLGQEDRKISIDSSQMPDNFLDKFKSTNCTVSGCKECGYCSEIAGRAVIVNDSFQKQTLAEYERVDELITTGTLWDV